MIELYCKITVLLLDVMLLIWKPPLLSVANCEIETPTKIKVETKEKNKHFFSYLHKNMKMKRFIDMMTFWNQTEG